MREEGLVANAAARGEELTRGLQALAAEDPRIGDVRGPGLMIGVELVKDRETREPAGELGEALTAACAGPRAAAADLRPRPQHHALDPARSTSTATRSRRAWASSRRPSLATV